METAHQQPAWGWIAHPSMLKWKRRRAAGASSTSIRCAYESTWEFEHTASRRASGCPPTPVALVTLVSLRARAKRGPPPPPNT